MTAVTAVTPRFGTDGVRGVANVELTAEWATGFGRVAARVLCAPARGTRRQFIVGRDTRASGGMLAAALAAGIASEGIDVVDIGVMSTPGVAWIAAERGVPGAVISASHNHYRDNGVKLFGPGGGKLTDGEQAAIETLQPGPAVTGPSAAARDRAGDLDGHVGSVVTDGSAVHSYENHLVASLEGRRLDGLRVVLDCANGAASGIAPAVVRRLGAEVMAVADDPDGTNINHECGSTHLDLLVSEVRARHADLGLAFDGDADRCIAVDHTGTEVDGDRMIGLFAIDLAERGRLTPGGVAVTVMTNLGFRLAMSERHIPVVETDVGDRNVLAAMEESGIVLGGEQSGHVIFRELATTGDGILTGLQLLDLVVRSARPLAELAPAVMARLPQRLVSVPVPDPSRLAGAEEVWREAAAVEAELGKTGRVLIRPSGTEPKVRVMVEAGSDEAAEASVERLRCAVERALATA